MQSLISSKIYNVELISSLINHSIISSFSHKRMERNGMEWNEPNEKAFCVEPRSRFLSLAKSMVRRFISLLVVVRVLHPV